MEVLRYSIRSVPVDSSNTVANEYTISIPSALVAVCAELNGADWIFNEVRIDGGSSDSRRIDSFDAVANVSLKYQFRVDRY